MASERTVFEEGTGAAFRRTGLNPLKWPPWRHVLSGSPSPFSKLSVAFFLTIILLTLSDALTLSALKEPLAIGGFSFQFRPAWFFGLLWAIGMGLPYGLAILLINSFTQWVLWGPAHPGLSSAMFDLGGLGLLTFFLRAYPINPNFRTLKDAGLLVLASFLASSCAAASAIASGTLGLLTQYEALEIWGSLWRGYSLVACFMAAPVAIGLGPALNRWKLAHFEVTWPSTSSRIQMTAGVLGGMVLILFFSTWNLRTSHRVQIAIRTAVKDPSLRRELLESQRFASVSQGALVATLLGLVATGTALALILRRRMEEQLAQERELAGHNSRMLAERTAQPDLFERLLKPYRGPLNSCWIRVLEFEPQSSELLVRGGSEPNDPMLHTLHPIVLFRYGYLYARRARVASKFRHGIGHHFAAGAGVIPDRDPAGHELGTRRVR